MKESFETFRPLLFGIAYRMLGSVMDAEDIVQEVYLRYQATPQESIRSKKNFLATIATRLSLNHLNSARTQREVYMGPWIPEPVITGSENPVGMQPAQRLDDHESISMAFLVLLERLTSVERAVFLLHEVFEYDYGEIARILEKSEAACRQICSRAKKHIAEHRPRFAAKPESQRALLHNFISAVERGEFEGIMSFLADDVTLYADGGGNVYGAATRPVHGKEHAALFILGSLRFLPKGYTVDVRELNGQPGIIVRDANGKALGVLSVDVDSHYIHVLRFIGNPDKLKRI